MTIHFFLQFKGGIGTTLAASLLTNYLQSSEQRVCYVDLDPVYQTRLSCVPISMERINIVDDSFETIDRSNFDEIMEKSIAHDGPMVVDVTATVAIPFLTYVNEKAFLHACETLGKKVRFHLILAGGTARDHTARGIQIMLDSQLVPVVVWENDYFGEVHNHGENFSQPPLFSNYQHQILGVLKLRNAASCNPFDVKEHIFSQLARLSL
jgi:hypothetical protein